MRDERAHTLGRRGGTRTRSPLPWARLALWSTPGLALGALTLTGWIPPAAEFGLWTVVGIGWVLLCRREGLARPIFILTFVGLLAGIQTGLVHGLFTETLVANNPSYAEDIAEVTMAARGQLLLFAVVVGVAWGALFGGITWALDRWCPISAGGSA